MALITQPTIARLFICQALYWCCSMIGITLTALIGLQLAPLNILATLPLALLVLGNLLAVQPLSLYMQRNGRRAGLLLGAACGVFGGLISALGVWLGDFSILCLGALLIGAYQASAMYYRFVALEAVPESAKGRASAYVIGGGVVAALIAPSLALWSKNALATPFTGAYLMMAALALIAAGVLSKLPQGTVQIASTGGWSTMRELLRRPVVRAAIATTAIGHGLMILVMNATPLAMRGCGLSIETSALVMQWHMLGMFLPAFVAGRLVDTLGSRRVAVIGSGVLLISAAIAVSGITRDQFLISSFLLGLGWNLMLIAGTTLLAQGHTPAERGHAQGLMELSNGSVAASASFASGALISGIGWNAVNISILPLIVIVLLMLIPSRRAQLA
ncbi:MFS transporter [Pseudomonas sp. M30-35]|uniref:MFS transporter n=1 Tax=Pseudomonas sp. M30-35 TaxID=1981174 RepID=UPI000B3C0C2D|nr:MFS transporter [Pseudomonas sp. M30-35]ARU88378.1 MFS transporter [Pseudomonas sp. M30-35]